MADTEEFPILCETCLGENPFVRMTKERCGKACKICDRPMTAFRWRPGPRARFKKTEVCITCAKMKNVCQTCVLDLKYGLPVQVRDTALEEHEKMEVPKSITNRDYLFEQYEKQVSETGDDGSSLPYGKVHKSVTLNKISRTRSGPYYKRNLPRICSFYVKGECTRGEECPYRHEKPLTGELANQNIKDRYYGVNDPVANKIMRLHKEREEGDGGPATDSSDGKARARGSRRGPSAPPVDQSVMTLFVGGVDARFSEEELREVFSPYGMLSTVSLIPNKGCAFVTFVQRSDAETAVAALHDTVRLHDVRLRVDWGRTRGAKSSSSSSSGAVAPPPGMSSFKPPAVHGVSHPNPNQFLQPPRPPQAPSQPPPPPGGARGRVQYTSMDPNAYQAKVS
eukprot:425790_1